MEKLNLHRYISWQNMQNVVYIVDERNGEMYFLEETSREIFLMLMKGIEIGKIVEIMSNKYETYVVKKDIEKDVKFFVEQLIESNIFERN